MSAIDTARKIRQIGNQARKAFIKRDEAVWLIELCLVSSEHGIMLGPPGTGKSSLIRFFSNATGLGFFRKLLNPDIKREDLVGPISPASIAAGKWDRAWLGLATNPIVFLDEIGKASGQVRNMVLDAMEERVVSSGDTELQIPLQAMFSASNETLDEDSEAVWDRFALRCVVGYITNSTDFISFLTSRGIEPVRNEVTDAEIKECREACLQMARQNLSEAVKTAMVDLWSGYKTVSSNRVSDRRWERLLVVAAANALLNGRDQIEVTDLEVGKMMLWQEIGANGKEIEAITKFVHDTVNKEEVALNAAAAIVAQIEAQARTAVSIEDKGKVNYKVDKMQREIAIHTGDKWAELSSRLASVKDRMVED